ncbi:MAG: peptidoglycan-binding protein [Deltaproteobacteria bacterium]|nr:peptidoglycan-binding protein [Deltaproteobacteria bacterium]
MGNFLTDVLKKDQRYASDAKISDPALLEPVTRQAVAAILVEAKRDYGLDLVLFESYRSQARQGQLYEAGATQLRRVGVHGYGLAGDLVKVVKGQLSWDGDYSFLGVLAQKHGLIWGGDWGEPDKPHSFRDNDHVQRCAVRDQQKLFAGLWYPGPDYNPYGDAAAVSCRLTSPMMRGAGIFQIQCRLRDFGFLLDKADGKYGPKTAAAVKLLQKKHNLPETGVVDEATAAAIAALGGTHA